MGAVGSKEPATLANEWGGRAGICKGFSTAGAKESATLNNERGSSTEFPCRGCTTPRYESPGSVGLFPLSLIVRSARITASMDITQQRIQVSMNAPQYVYWQQVQILQTC